MRRAAAASEYEIRNRGASDLDRLDKYEEDGSRCAICWEEIGV